MDNVSFYKDVTALNTALKDHIRMYSAVFTLCDENTQRHCLTLLQAALRDSQIIDIKSGEQHKNVQTCEHIWDILTQSNADRKSLLLCLGGGVITDMGGFAAACYKRGIDFIHIPTTLLGMVDAAIGGKTGIDFNNYKNQIGLFCDARAVMVCPAFLHTLDERQILSGMAEVVKHYLIADRELFLNFKIDDSKQPDLTLIQKAVNIKLNIVTQDPFEKNIRKALNFGHTIGHAVESYYLSIDQPILHGEAVAIGMAIEGFISEIKRLLSSEDVAIIFKVLKEIFKLKPLLPDVLQPLLSLILQDKKNESGIVKMALLTAIGECKIDIAVSNDEIEKAIYLYNEKLAG